MLIIKDIINEQDTKPYFRILINEVFNSFYNTSAIFDKNIGVSRKDYPYLRYLFRKWNIKKIFESVTKNYKGS